MELIGKNVIHKIHKEGVVISQDDNYITVEFNKKHKKVVEQYQYPKAFEKFLQVVDDVNANEKIKTEIETIKKQEDDKKQQKIDSEWEVRPKGIKATCGIQYVNNDEYKAFRKKFKSIEAFYNEYRKALNQEIFEAKLNGGKKIPVAYAEKLFNNKDTTYRYEFELEEEINIPEGIDINIYKDDMISKGRVISCDGLTLQVNMLTDIGDVLEDIKISYEAWFLLELLQNRLEDIKIQANEITKQLILEQNCKETKGSFVKSQQNAIKQSCDQPICMIWGPPGTGKTETLAKIALEHMSKGNRVLMVSQSNISVDEAAMRILKLNEEIMPGQVVRYGFPKKEEVLKHDFISTYKLALMDNPELAENIKLLLEEKKNLNRNSRKYKDVVEKIRTLKNKIKDQEDFYLETASFIATTIVKATIKDILYRQRFDVVIFDEASMAYVPQIAVASLMAKKHLICVGDFCQLPPIVQSGEDSILNRDIYYYSGITYAVDNGYKHNWLCMLDVQYRMNEKIAKFISDNMYKKQIKSNIDLEKRAELMSKINGKKPMDIMDLTETMSVCMRLSDYSRFNILSAFICLYRALLMDQSLNIGIITPYNAQSRLIKAMIRDINFQNNIECATVHQFQGSQKNVIIYDAVDCYRSKAPGKLNSQAKNNLADRLFNVAVTRTQEKFILVTHIDYMESHLAGTRMFRKLVNNISTSPHDYSIKDLQYLPSRTKSMIFYNENEGQQTLLNELREAQKSIYIDIPYKARNDLEGRALIHKITEIILKKKLRGLNIKIRYEKEQQLDVFLDKIAIYEPFNALNPLIIIDKKIIWYGLPHSEATFVVSGKAKPITYRPIIRFEGEKTAKIIYKFIAF